MAASAPGRITPMFEQYLRIKEEHPGALLFFRMGDFYELFFDDAEVAARELQIALTCRNPSQENPVPMCGVPHHAVDNYLPLLLDKGYKVAICDQVEDPKQAKGLVKREVTRVLTPGTLVEDNGLSAKIHNYLAALVFDASRGEGALAFIDVSTGEWSGFSARSEPGLWQWLLKLGPRELLLPPGFKVPHQYGELRERVTYVPELFFDVRAAGDRLLKAQGVVDLATLDLGDKPDLVRACGALLAYLAQTQRQEMGHLGQFQPLNLGRYLILDEITERNLEIFRTLDGRTGRGTLRSVVDRTMTPMGGRYLEVRLRQPWREQKPIERTQAAVALLAQRQELREGLRGALDKVYDLERLSTRIVLGRATPKDFAALRNSLAMLPGIGTVLNELIASTDTPPEALAHAAEDWDAMEDLCERLRTTLADSPPPTITEGGLFKSGWHAELDELLELAEHGEAKLQEMLEQERQSSGLPKLKLGFNKVFGYYFELSRASGQEPPAHFVRRQTLANAERFVTQELGELEDRILQAAGKRRELEYRLFLELREAMAQARPRFMDMARRLARIDYWQSLAETAVLCEWRQPSLHRDLRLRIRSGRHPVVEAVQGSAGFVPNDLSMDEESRLLLITGPNMAGKSTVLRQAAIIAILAQIGSFVPAAEAEIGLVDRVFSRVGASDNLAQGQSTFMVEMMETARILRQATRRSLVILDEIGRGTGTFDGMALAWAVVEELARRASGGIRTLFATHYHELTSLEGRVEGLRNFTIAVREYKGEIVFLRRLVPGPSDKSYGVEVAKLAGVPQNVVQRARELLSELERKREGVGEQHRAIIGQSLLPGLPRPQAPAEPQGPAEPLPHPVLDALRAIRPDALSPMQALQMIYDWKATLEKEE
ncbi:DNA mismatch repair protein mutS [Desulfovibrio sp. X2]|uniref:DNA mismatch repair protein MutS n=1 Tax=Desulfovibrio sp. X2 TaxID=941449 RepID=UPI000358D198|nr:DNA mismatch repair protein MutS [Desulfovibrio sp. X2]EPR42298.1 DNA mismatch repair protein mutS [Desulfovibrio sp. X2]